MLKNNGYPIYIINLKRISNLLKIAMSDCCNIVFYHKNSRILKYQDAAILLKFPNWE